MKLNHCAFVILLVALLVSCSQSDYHPSYKGGKRVYATDIEFDDGDTFTWKSQSIRVLGIDTPEIAHPEFGYQVGQPFGEVAAESTRVWMLRADMLELVLDGRDRYRRRLAHVFIDGELLAVRLLDHALAYETVSFFGDNGYPDLAQQILDTARRAPKPEFEAPYKWKQKQRRKS